MAVLIDYDNMVAGTIRKYGIPYDWSECGNYEIVTQEHWDTWCKENAVLYDGRYAVLA